jgi:predicted Holliday junction resolvase-like endonuclease
LILIVILMIIIIYLTSITVTQAQLGKSVKTAKHHMSTTLKNV